MISGFLPVFLCACFGGCLAELLRWYNLRESTEFYVYRAGAVYWLITTLMIVAGGVLAVLYGTEPKNAILILQIGLSTPLIIKSLAETRASVPEPVSSGPGRQMAPGDTHQNQPSVLRFLAGR
jgi:hypothetical protein